MIPPYSQGTLLTTVQDSAEGMGWLLGEAAISCSLGLSRATPQVPPSLQCPGKAARLDQGVHCPQQLAASLVSKMLKLEFMLSSSQRGWWRGSVPPTQ